MSPEQNNKLDRKLRAICILTFLPSLAFNIAHGALYNTALPAVGLVPHFFSVLIAIFELRLLQKCQEYQIILDNEPPRKKQQIRIAFLDILAALSLLTCIILSFIILDQTSYYRGGVGRGILGAYGILPFMVNAAIHFYFFCAYIGKNCSIFKQNNSNVASCEHCPHCQAAQTAPLLEQTEVNPAS